MRACAPAEAAALARHLRAPLQGGAPAGGDARRPMPEGALARRGTPGRNGAGAGARRVGDAARARTPGVPAGKKASLGPPSRGKARARAAARRGRRARGGLRAARGRVRRRVLHAGRRVGHRADLLQNKKETQM